MGKKKCSTKLYEISCDGPPEDGIAMGEDAGRELKERSGTDVIFLFH